MDPMIIANKVMVGGVNSPVRAFKAVGGNPLVMQRGKGSKLFDVKGNAYTDYCLSWGWQLAQPNM